MILFCKKKYQGGEGREGISLHLCHIGGSDESRLNALILLIVFFVCFAEKE